MFMDEVTLQTLTSEGQMPDTMGFIGLWKIVVVKNLPYTDMRRVGKIPKFLAHRLFSSARYTTQPQLKYFQNRLHGYTIFSCIIRVILLIFSVCLLWYSFSLNARNLILILLCTSPFAYNFRYSIWLDSKLRLQLDPLLILEYFLWRKGHEYAISNHYDRHCLWEEVAQNKRLNKYNHSVIDEQFAFYQADGMKRFNASDPNKLLPSSKIFSTDLYKSLHNLLYCIWRVNLLADVPEGSFIVRAHTPMSNLFSCLWFNEVDRFTPRDQLSFAYTYHKLRRTNPEKSFYLNMFKVHICLVTLNSNI